MGFRVVLGIVGALFYAKFTRKKGHFTVIRGDVHPPKSAPASADSKPMKQETIILLKTVHCTITLHDYV
jgi:hypothetical protein